MRLEGLITAMVTPFLDNGHLDEEGLRSNIEEQIAAGVNGLLVLGTTGESPTLSEQEQERVISILIESARGRVLTMVGTGSNCTGKTIAMTQRAERMGADCALLINPYYNCPQQEGLFQHFQAVHDACGIPLCLYNHPKRTGVRLELNTIMRLEKLERVIGIKECSGDIGFTQQVIDLRKGFSVLCGDDPNAFSYLSLGCDGHISVASNLIPKQMVQLVRASCGEDLESGRARHFALLSLLNGLFIESNPVPVKAAMEMMGMPAGGCRLPLTEMSEMNWIELKRVVEHHFGKTIKNTV